MIAETAGAGDVRVGVFLRWARERLQREQDALTAAGLARRFEEARLFGEDDDHAFRPDPYYQS